MLFISVILTLPFFAQRNSEKADRYFNQNQFETAIKYYLLDVNSDSKKAKEYAMAKLADCYRITGEFEKAEEIYRKILKRKKTVPENYLNYALSLKSSAKYAEAKLQFEEYIKLKPDDLMGPIYLQSCDSAQKWLDESIGKEVKNMESINTKFSDFGACLNNRQLFFSSAREGSKQAFISFDGGGEMHRMDLYQISLLALLKKESKPTDVQNMKAINSSMHEGTPTFSADGNEVYFSKTVKGTRNEKNNVLNVLQVFYSRKDSLGNWTAPVSAFNFNNDSYSVGHPCLSADGQTIFYMSDMPGGFGKTDIYCSTRTPGNKIWSKPKNLGNKVNTFGHELFPTIATNNVLYFSSNTHPGMGQLDIFKAELINGIWSNVQNMKPPINSISNDFAISFDDSNTRGFFSSDRFNGKGAEDIYSFSLDGPLQLCIKQDSLIINNSFIYDDIKYKLTTLNDSSTFEFPADTAKISFHLDNDKVYQIAEKKNGMPINKVELSKKFNFNENSFSYTIKTSLLPVNISGVLPSINNISWSNISLQLISDKEVITSTKPNSDGSFTLSAGLLPEKEYQIVLSLGNSGFKE